MNYKALQQNKAIELLQSKHPVFYNAQAQGNAMFMGKKERLIVVKNAYFCE